MKTLWLVRHARPLIEAGRCYGRLNVPADAQATQDAALALSQALKPWRGDIHIHHSPLQRCEQLAHALKALEPDFIAKPDARLQEMDFGSWEGESWDAIGEAAINTWAQDLAAHAPGGGEPLMQMLHRVNAALQQARLAPQPHQVWITHAGVARCVQWLLQHSSLPPQSADWTLPAPACGQWLKLSLS